MDGSDKSGRPQTIGIPADVEELFQELEQGYGTHDLNMIMSRVSDDFLHQGLDRDHYRYQVSQSYLLKQVNWMKVNPLHFETDGDDADFAAFADSNLGVLPAAENLLPFIEGSRLRKEGGRWKLLGNQSPTTMGLYKSFHQVSGCFDPVDRELYRTLLPDPLQLPEKPKVSVKICRYEHLRLPLPRYIMAHVQILAQYKNIQGWFTLTMPEDAWTPVEMGRTLGYPKYVADFMSFYKASTGWTGEVRNEGEIDFSLFIDFKEDPSRASLFERGTSRMPGVLIRKLLPAHKEKPWFLMMPGANKDDPGEALLLVGDPQFTGIPKVREGFGRIEIKMKTSLPWEGLFSSETETKGVFMQFAGELMLRHRQVK